MTAGSTRDDTEALEADRKPGVLGISLVLHRAFDGRQFDRQLSRLRQPRSNRCQPRCCKEQDQHLQQPGPTRDGRFKPDVAAPGTDIVAAKGFSRDGEKWLGMTGTSMASPFVRGVAGLMLAIEPQLTAAQIEGIMRSTATPPPGSSFRWVNDAGFGVINPEACLEQATHVNNRKDRTGQ